MKRKLVLAGVAALAVAVVAIAVGYASSRDGGDTEEDVVAPTQPPAATAPAPQPPATQTPDTAVSATPVPSQSGMTPQTPAPVLPSQPPAVTLPPGRHTEPAPIDGAEVLVLESFPPQYTLQVKAGLPSGCAERYTYEVARDGDVIKVTVLNTLPDGNVACTMIYGMYDLNIGLGNDFVSGRTYTVQVNDRELTFTAQ